MSRTSTPPGGASGNSLYINVDGTHFEERVVSATGDLGASCVDDGDWDQDRYRDFLVCGAELNLFHNSGPTGVTPSRGTRCSAPPVPFPRDATLADVNGDGWDDLVVITQTQLQIRLNHRELVNRFSVVDFSAPLIQGNSVSVGDLTGDGAQDVYVVEGVENGPGGPQNAPDKLFTGPNWSQLPIPQADVGTGDNSEFITVLGRKALIVTNGRDFARGPIQLISFQPAGYVRPLSASPLRVPLVPAFNRCISPNSSHGPPLANPSCAPPGQASLDATVGTLDANGHAPQSTGFFKASAANGDPSTPADEADVRLNLSISDVRKRFDEAR